MDQGGTVAHQRFQANLFAPLPTKPLGINIVPGLNYFHEQRGYGASAQSLTPTKDLRALALGVSLFKDFGESSTGYFTLTHFGRPDFGASAESMIESFAGTKLRGWFPYFSNEKLNETYFFLRLRAYPDCTRFMPFIGKKVSFENGFFFDVLVPSHLIAGWENADEKWRFQGGARLVGRDYPVLDAWWGGYTTELLLGVRRHISSVFYLSLEGGLQQENLKLVSRAGAEQARLTTQFAPWITLSVQTLFPSL